ncbi:hypothetical protein [Photobacterium piscicola]|uniref:hypothetical protein n=1 Tax=Photobacterium piscicola TaxID=1378299 RepID=UPI00373516D5
MLFNLLKDIKALLIEIFIAPIVQYKQPYSVIDEHIKPAVDGLNSIDGVETIASCHGHLIGHMDSPYVYFKAPVDIATYLHNHIWNATKDSTIYWEITGRYNCESELCFSLRSPPFRVCLSPSIFTPMAIWLPKAKIRKINVSISQRN